MSNKTENAPAPEQQGEYKGDLQIKPRATPRKGLREKRNLIIDKLAETGFLEKAIDPSAFSIDYDLLAYKVAEKIAKKEEESSRLMEAREMASRYSQPIEDLYRQQYYEPQYPPQMPQMPQMPQQQPQQYANRQSRRSRF